MCKKREIFLPIPKMFKLYPFTSVKELVTLGPGGYFGELALQSNEPRKATVTATSPTVCWTMDRSTFTNMLGMFMDMFLFHNFYNFL